MSIECCVMVRKRRLWIPFKEIPLVGDYISLEDGVYKIVKRIWSESGELYLDVERIGR